MAVSRQLLKLTLSSLAFSFLAAASLVHAAEEMSNADILAGEEKYTIYCASCHEGALLEAPVIDALRQYSAKRVVDALEFGVMATSGMALSREEKHQVAYYITGEQFSDQLTSTTSFSCTARRTIGDDYSAAVTWNGWGQNSLNTRHQAGEVTLTKDNVAALELKWAFAFPETTRVRAQPVVTPEAIFIGGQEGVIYALDADNGCPIWTFAADSEVRGALYVDTDDSGLPQTILFGDFDAQAYALDARSGELKWKTPVHPNPMATITGSVISDGNVVIVPVSSLEIIPASRPEYECCKFRGAVSALAIDSGELLWRTYTVDEPRPTIKTTVGTQQYGPSGAPSWSGPTIDSARGMVYATTGQNYSSPATNTSDSVLGLDINTGEIKWVTQATKNDAWNGGCSRGTPNCPEENGPDYDIGASPILAKNAAGRELIFVGQKSGMVFALDPDNEGKIVWQKRVGSGGTMGGVHWGMTTDGEKLYVGVSDLPTNNPGNVGEAHPGMQALAFDTGEMLWRNDLPNSCDGQGPYLCWHGISAAIASSPGLVFGGSMDGKLRAFDSDNGAVLWEENTNRSFGEVNGIAAKGGSIEADGPVIANGKVYITSGYEKWAETPGNVLLVYGLENNE